MIIPDCRMRYRSIKMKNEIISDRWGYDFYNNFKTIWKDNKRRKKIGEYFGSVRTPCLKLSEAKPPETIEELTSLMEQAIPVGVETWYDKSVTGEAYIEYLVGCNNPDERKISAILSWHWNSFIKQLEENPNGVLYWRIKPEYSEWEDEGFKTAKIYARYLVSNKPVDEILLQAAPYPLGVTSGNYTKTDGKENENYKKTA